MISFSLVFVFFFRPSHVRCRRHPIDQKPSVFFFHCKCQSINKLFNCKIKNKIMENLWMINQFYCWAILYGLWLISLFDPCCGYYTNRHYNFLWRTRMLNNSTWFYQRAWHPTLLWWTEKKERDDEKNEQREREILEMSGMVYCRGNFVVSLRRRSTVRTTAVMLQ